MDAASTLRPVASGHSRIGWNGFTLDLPEDWNLSLHAPAKTMDCQGLLVFSDLHGPALEIRWQTPRRLGLPANPQRALDRSAAKLRRRGDIVLLDGACLLRKNGIALIADQRHLYELHCPRTPDRIQDLTHDFMAGLKLLAGGPWLWSVYGIHAWLPRSAKLRHVSLRAGDCRLTFHIPRSKDLSHATADGLQVGPRGGIVTLAAFTLARQILRNRTLRQWACAELPPIRNCPKGTWEESDNQAAWRATFRRLGRLFSCETRVRHDLVGNRIHWTHLEQRVKNG